MKLALGAVVRARHALQRSAKAVIASVVSLTSLLERAHARIAELKVWLRYDSINPSISSASQFDRDQG